MADKTISEVGEKVLISTIIKPRLNPLSNPDLAGDDCAILRSELGSAFCISTDRVPADLISFRLGIIDHFGLGNYLAVLNLSDIAAMGAEPRGLLLNLGLPHDLPVTHFEQIIDGAATACREYGCEILGGDMSSASELSLSATSIGSATYEGLLRRKGAQPDDLVYCTGYLGLTSTAFKYFLDAKKKGLQLGSENEQLLKDQFQKPTAKFQFGRIMRVLDPPVTCMDNTDGAAQTLLELCEINSVGAVLTETDLPIHQVSREVATYLNCSVLDVALGPGADFNLLGTIRRSEQPKIIGVPGLHIIGRTIAGSGICVEGEGKVRPFAVRGWNYYSGSAIVMAASESSKRP